MHPLQTSHTRNGPYISISIRWPVTLAVSPTFLSPDDQLHRPWALFLAWSADQSHPLWALCFYPLLASHTHCEPYFYHDLPTSHTQREPYISIPCWQVTHTRNPIFLSPVEQSHPPWALFLADQLHPLWALYFYPLLTSYNHYEPYISIPCWPVTQTVSPTFLFPEDQPHPLWALYFYPLLTSHTHHEPYISIPVDQLHPLWAPFLGCLKSKSVWKNGLTIAIKRIKQHLT
jgi:hypothetical protein